MNRINRPAALNRSLLATIGVALGAVGGLAIAAYFRRLTWLDSEQPVVADTTAPPTWVLWVIIACAAVLALLCLRWLLAQIHRMPGQVSWQLAAETSAGITELWTGTVAELVVGDIERYVGVRSASAWLSGARWAPELHLVVTAEANADVIALRRQILGHAVARLRQALEVEIVPVTLELHIAKTKRTDPGPARVR